MENEVVISKTFQICNLFLHLIQWDVTRKETEAPVSDQLGQTRLCRTGIYSKENEVLISISLWYRANISRCIGVLFWWGKISRLQTSRLLYLTCIFFFLLSSKHLIDSDVIKSKQKARRWCLYSSLDVCDCLVRCHPLSFFFFFSPDYRETVENPGSQ